MELTPDEQYVRQNIPIEIHGNHPVVIEIDSLSGNGVNDVGLRCPVELWQSLTQGTDPVSVRLITCSDPSAKIGGVDPGSVGTSFLGYLKDTHYLFYIVGRSGAKASISITFHNPPVSVTPAEIIVCQTPIDTKL